MQRLILILLNRFGIDIFCLIKNLTLMKTKLLLTFFLTLLSFGLNAQNASTYFPSSTGYKWYYSNTPLDSLNNPMTSLRTYQIDSFAAVTNYQGLVANRVLSKSGLLTIGQPTPYTDSLYYNFQGTNAWSYLNLLGLLDSVSILDSTLLAFIRSLDGWYNTYRFSQTVNTNYTFLSRDTTITISGTSYPIRVSSTGRRLNDQSVTTVNGTYLAKKFLISAILSYGITIPPFPTVYIPIVTRPDTVYIASDVWIIKDVIPSVNVDFTGLGFPVSFFIPGAVKELTNPTSSINVSGGLVPSSLSLGQNYPNPFNPSTKINFSVPFRSEIRMEVHNSLGSRVAILVNEDLEAGNYTVDFSGESLPSGVYYYTLTAGSFSEVKKMILLK